MCKDAQNLSVWWAFIKSVDRSVVARVSSIKANSPSFLFINIRHQLKRQKERERGKESRVDLSWHHGQKYKNANCSPFNLSEKAVFAFCKKPESDWVHIKMHVHLRYLQRRYWSVFAVFKTLHTIQDRETIITVRMIILRPRRFDGYWSATYRTIFLR